MLRVFDRRADPFYRGLLLRRQCCRTLILTRKIPVRFFFFSLFGRFSFDTKAADGVRIGDRIASFHPSGCFHNLRIQRAVRVDALDDLDLFRRAGRFLRKGVNKSRFGLISLAERHPYLVTDPELQFIRRAISKKAVRMFSFVFHYNIQIFHASPARFLCVCLFIGEADFLLQ